MSVIAAAVKHMMAAGMEPDAIVAAIADMEASTPKDAQAERKRAADRERMRLKREESRAMSRDVADVGDTSKVEVLSPKESPHTPKENPPISPSTPKETPLRGSKKAVRLPADWSLPADWREWAINRGLPKDRCDLEATKMLNWSVNAGAKGAKKDWFRAWQNWVLSAIDNLPRARGSPGRPPERYDPFKALAQELSDEQNHGSDNRNRNDAQGVPFLAVEYQRR